MRRKNIVGYIIPHRPYKHIKEFEYHHPDRQHQNRQRGLGKVGKRYNDHIKQSSAELVEQQRRNTENDQRQRDTQYRHLFEQAIEQGCQTRADDKTASHNDYKLLGFRQLAQRCKEFAQKGRFLLIQRQHRPAGAQRRQSKENKGNTPPPMFGAVAVAFETHPRADGHIQYLPQSTHNKNQHRGADAQFFEFQRHDPRHHTDTDRHCELPQQNQADNCQ